MVVITKKNCLRIFSASMRVISAMTGNPPLHTFLAMFSVRPIVIVPPSVKFMSIKDIMQFLSQLLGGTSKHNSSNKGRVKLMQ